MTLKRCNVADLMGPLTQREITAENYLVAPANLSRADNVQEYYAKELGMDVDGVEPRRIIRMYRPVDEVFSPDALKSFEGQTVTLQHPDEPVTADNWKEHAVGEVTGVKSDAAGKHMTGRLVIRARPAIDAVLDGTKQMSCGYSFDADMTPGKTADGRAYDGSMRNIRGNHHAIVDAARGGPTCRIADRERQPPETGDAKMAIKKTIDGISLEFVDDAQASMVEKIVADTRAALKTAQDAVTGANKRATDGEAALTTEQAKTAKLVADHATEVASLKAQIPSADQQAQLTNAAKLASDHAAEIARLKAQIPTAEQIEKLATDRAQLIVDAKALVPTLETTGKTVTAIRAAALTSVIAANDARKHIANAVLGGLEPDKVSEAIAKAAFDAVVAATDSGDRDEPVRGSIGDPAVGRSLIGDRNRGGQRPPAITGRALMTYRENHGGKNPPKASA